MNRTGKLDLFIRQIAFAVLGQLIRQNQQRIERRAQLVAHVGQEFALVFGGQSELLGLFFQRLAGLLHFAVLAFHFRVLLGQQLGLVFKLGVGLLQFFLLALQLAGERLRLLEQVFG